MHPTTTNGAETARLTFAQAASAMHVSESWLRKRVTARTVAHHRLGRRIWFTPEDIEANLAGTAVAPARSA